MKSSRYYRTSFNWTVRTLTGATKFSNVYQFTYNDEGYRTSKTVNGVTTTYYLAGSQIIAEETNGNYTVYLYDAGGSPMGMQFHGIYYADEVWDVYWFEKDLLGNIVAVYDESGNKLVSYYYDAWGNCEVEYDDYDDYMVTFAAYSNPFRYRGYYYDYDLGMYYLNSRYYDARNCRFISPDVPDVLFASPYNITDKNLYAYCNNDPVNYIDPSGYFAISAAAIVYGIIIGAAIGAGLSFVSTARMDYNDDGEVFNGSVGVDEYIGNIAGGLIAGAGIGVCTTLGAGLGAAMAAGECLKFGGIALSGAAALGVGAGSAFVSGGVGYAVRTAINSKQTFQVSDMFIEAGANTASGMISFVGGMAGGITGVKIPGAKKSFGSFVKYHSGLTYFGAYPTKFFVSRIKNRLQEIY